MIAEAVGRQIGGKNYPQVIDGSCWLSESHRIALHPLSELPVSFIDFRIAKVALF